jgi:hypothetical protein
MVITLSPREMRYNLDYESRSCPFCGQDIGKYTATGHPIQWQRYATLKTCGDLMCKQDQRAKPVKDKPDKPIDKFIYYGLCKTLFKRIKVWNKERLRIHGTYNLGERK